RAHPMMGREERRGRAGHPRRPQRTRRSRAPLPNSRLLSWVSKRFRTAITCADLRARPISESQAYVRFACGDNAEGRKRRVSPDLTSAMGIKRGIKSAASRPASKQKAPLSRAFVVAGAGFEPATSGL